MLFQAEPLDERELAVVTEIEDLKASLRWQLTEPRRWVGSLRSLSFARNIQGSNSIEGYDAALDDAAAVAVGEEPLDASEETTLALAGYRDAMTYVLQLSDEPDFEYSEQLIKGLHFMMTKYSLKNRPGKWRVGAIYVHTERTGQIVQEGADIRIVPTLMHELVDQMEHPPAGIPAIVQAGMAHLNLAMIHPFRDGNGRMARCLQSLMLARQGVLAPVFMSVEEYLGRNTESYYDVLAVVGGGSWQPEQSAKPWTRYILTAHLRQAQTLQTRVRESEQMWEQLDRIAAIHKLPDRVTFALFDAALGLRVRRSTYQANFNDEALTISDQTASRDLGRLVEAGLLVPSGEKRARVYNGGAQIIEMRRQIVASRIQRDDSDPFGGFPLAPAS